MESIFIRQACHSQNVKVRNKKKSLTLQIVYILFILQAALSYSHFPVLQLASYLDEAVSAILFLSFLFKSFCGFRLKKSENLIILFSFLLVSLGFLSNILFKIQPAYYCFVDAFTCFKFIFTYLGIRSLFDGKVSSTFVTDNFGGISKFFAILFFFLTVHDSFFTPFFPLNEYRFFAYSIQLFYVHPQFLAFACVLCICVLLSSLKQHRRNIVYILMLSFVIVRTFRVKAIGFIAVVFFLLVLVYVFHVRSQKVMLFLLLVCAIIVGWDQIQTYFFNSRHTARAIMTLDGFRIANRYFPFGSGFATFGSYMAAAHYSPLYQEYGYNAFYGMSEASINYLMDTFWPTVVAQFGYIGTTLFCGIIAVFFRITSQIRSMNVEDFVAQLSILCYMIISSTSESAFFNPSATVLFLVFALYVCENSSETVSKTKQSQFDSKYFAKKG